MSGIRAHAYSLPQKLLHWAMGLFILYNLIFSDGIEEWDHAADAGNVTPDILWGANLHAYVGMTVLALAVIRLALRLVQGAPDAPADEPRPFQLLAKAVHIAFYVLFFAMPLTGIAKYYFDVDPAGFLHAEPIKIAMWVLIVAHLAAIPVHRLLWKSNILPRMTTG